MMNVIAATVRRVTVARHILHVEFESHSGNIQLVDDVHCADWIRTRSIVVRYALC